MKTLILYFIIAFTPQEDRITNPVNAEYVNEIAFNLDIEPAQVTQKQFNLRYR